VQAATFGFTNDIVNALRLATEALNKAEALDDSLPQVHFTRSMLNGALGRYDEAIDSALRAIKADPGYADGYGVLAQVLFTSGQIAEAKIALDRAKYLNPRYTFTYLWLEAQYDAVAIATNAKNVYQRARPDGLADKARERSDFSYPSARSAAAYAAAGMLTYLFPDEADDFEEAALQSSETLLDAGLNYPSDIAAGLSIERAVAEELVALAKSDNPDSEFTGTRPQGPGNYQGELFVYPTSGQWKTWVITSPDDFLPPPPPALDSPEMAAEINALKAIERTVPV
jgi:tetratricopeptide (TPR) repeat protein